MRCTGQCLVIDVQGWGSAGGSPGALVVILPDLTWRRDKSAMRPGEGHNVEVSEGVDRVLSVEQAAQELGLAADRVWSLAAAGVLRSVPKSWPPRVWVSSVESFASATAEHRPDPDGPRQPGGDRSPVAPNRGGVTPPLSVEAAARLVGLRPAILRRSIANGELPAVGSPPRLQRSDLDAYLDRCRIKPGELSHLDANAKRRAPPREPPLTRDGRPDRRYGRR